MGYNLSIGELSVIYDNNTDYPNISLECHHKELKDAPAFDEPTDNTNERWPSYTGWTDFASYVGLTALFFGHDDKGIDIREDALISNHPGCIPLTDVHRRDVNKALAAYKIKYPDAIPTYGKKQEHLLDIDKDNPRYNSEMARLVWLAYWVNWACDNCKQPVFVNT